MGFLEKKKTYVHHEEAERDQLNFSVALQIVIKASEITDHYNHCFLFCTKVTHLQERQHTLPVVLPNLAKIWRVPRPSPPVVLCLLMRDLPLFHSCPSLLHPAEQPGFHIPKIQKIYLYLYLYMLHFVHIYFSVTHTLHLRRPKGKTFPSNLFCRLLESLHYASRPIT